MSWHMSKPGFWLAIDDDSRPYTVLQFADLGNERLTVPYDLCWSKRGIDDTNICGR